MAEVMKTPGVYIAETPAFPNSVVEVATAVPAFVGYTEKADNNGKALKNVPTRISSMAEYLQCFGGLQKVLFHVKKADSAATPMPDKAFSLGADEYAVVPAKPREEIFLLAPSMRLFFENGGGACSIVSVGSYYEGPVASDALMKAVDLLNMEEEPTMVVIPDAMHLPSTAACIAVQQHVMQHCKSMQSRIAILDIYNGYLAQDDAANDPVQSFRDQIGINNLDFAAAYYPWVETTAFTSDDVTYDWIDADDLTEALTREAGLAGSAPHLSQDVIAELKTPTARFTPKLLNDTLTNLSHCFASIIAEIRRQLNTLPPSAAMAGVYTMVDNARGVWKAPANVSLNGVLKPAVQISDTDQQSLNVESSGRSVNAIRSFAGEGVLVWGARTLDGNSMDWRYVNVRRTMIMIEQSIRLATRAYVFESNTANTWVTVKSMISNFLTNLWKRGGLAGAATADAYKVFCGLGETMTGDDVLAGIMRVTVMVAVTHPAEFLEFTFEQQMQKS